MKLLTNRFTTIHRLPSSAAKLSIFAFTLALSSQAAYAGLGNSLPKDDTARVTVGLNVVGARTAYNTFETTLLPSAFYDNNKIYAQGSLYGLYFYNDGKHQVSAFVQPTGTQFSPDNASGDFSQLDERQWTAAAGLSYLYLSPIGAFRGQVGKDVLGRSDGTVGRLAYITKFEKDQWTLYPSIGFEWFDDNYNNYYYGISEKESAKTGIPVYTSDSSLDPYANINAFYKYNDKWSGFIGQKITYLPNVQYDSPMVDNRLELRTIVGVLYEF